MGAERPTILCLASYRKGDAFLEECARAGARVEFLTVEKLREADWPRDAISGFHWVPDMGDFGRVRDGASWLATKHRIARIVALDEFDLETAAGLREHLRVPGPGVTATRVFRDKLAMREAAAGADIPVPGFTGVSNDDAVGDWMADVPPPWLLKPRTEASAVGIRMCRTDDEVRTYLHELGDRRSHFLLERYIPGDVWHADAIVADGRPQFMEIHRYERPPFDIMHGGGLFCTRTVERDDPAAATLRTLAAATARGLDLIDGAMHAEFIRDAEGNFHFIETAARVGGANIAEMVEAATGVNLWREWARLEVARARGSDYSPPAARAAYAGILISLARQEWPDTTAYDAPEVVWRMRKRQHAGLIVAADGAGRVAALLDDYARRFRDDFLAVLPAPEKATD
jgi:hypothetical protein